MEKEERGLILDSTISLAFYSHIHSKIHLTVDNNIAAKRIYNDNIRKNEKYTCVEDAAQKLYARRTSEIHRYKTLWSRCGRPLKLRLCCRYFRLQPLIIPSK